MALLRYLTHPQVQIDAAVPVPRWGLNAQGQARAQLLASSGRLQATGRITSSDETKSLQTAAPIAAALGLQVEVDPKAHENDRSATGFLVPAEFEQVANAFFAHPRESIRGWEKAIDAQARIVAAALLAMRKPLPGDVLMVGHGGVGTLLFCHLSGIPIQRLHDQPAGGGNIWAYDIETAEMRQGWLSIEQWITSGV